VSTVTNAQAIRVDIGAVRCWAAGQIVYREVCDARQVP
jgi:hypothetical protein